MYLISMEENNKLYYSIKEVSEIVGVNSSVLRFWEKEFPHIAPKRNDRKTRFYTRENIDDIKQIYFLLKEQGLTLEGAKLQLKHKKKKLLSSQQIIEKLTLIRQELEDLKKSLDENG